METTKRKRTREEVRATVRETIHRKKEWIEKTNKGSFGKDSGCFFAHGLGIESKSAVGFGDVAGGGSPSPAHYLASQ